MAQSAIVPFSHENYLVADMLMARLDGLGLTVSYVMFSRDFKERGTAGSEVSIAIDLFDVDDQYLFDVDREAKLNEFLAAYPDATPARESSYGSAPEMYVRGVNELGIAWEINFHAGTCERVQVGTKRVEQFDPAYVANIPMVTVDEPVYEYVCADPIVTAGLAS